MADDLDATLRLRRPEHALRRAAKRLEALGIVTTTMPHPHTRGSYGLLYALAPRLLHGTRPYVHPAIEMYQTHVFIPNADARFHFGETYTDDLSRGWKFAHRNITTNLGGFVNRIESRGHDRPAFVSMGRYENTKDVRQKDVYVYLPEVIFDIDRGRLEDAWTVTRHLLRDLEKIAGTLDGITVSFSGSKGFHVSLPIVMIHPDLVFTSHSNARDVLAHFARIVTEIDVDVSTFIPSQPIRVTGSKHATTGLYKTTFRAYDWLDMKPSAVIEAAQSFTPSDFSAYRSIAPTGVLSTPFNKASYQVRMERAEAVRHRPTGKGTKRKAGAVIRSLLPGVTENVSWHTRHNGRHRAAYIFAAFLLDGGHTGDMHLDNTLETGGIERALMEWNERNNPPLSTTELLGQLRGAERTTGGNA